MYTASVRAVNKFGKSEALYVPFITKVEPIKTIAETKVKDERNNSKSEVLGVILGVVFMTATVIVAVVFTALTYRRCLNESSSMNSLSLVPGEKETVPMPSRKEQSLPNQIPSSQFHSGQQMMPTISFTMLGKVFNLVLPNSHFE